MRKKAPGWAQTLTFNQFDRDLGCRADLAPLWGRQWPARELDARKSKRGPNNQSSVEEYMLLASVSLRTVRYHLSKGDCGYDLGASWHGQKSKIAANDIVEAPNKSQPLLGFACAVNALQG
jgi:hypothetical protein